MRIDVANSTQDGAAARCMAPVGRDAELRAVAGREVNGRKVELEQVPRHGPPTVRVWPTPKSVLMSGRKSEDRRTITQPLIFLECGE
jgi:hypothetical protein